MNAAEAMDPIPSSRGGWENGSAHAGRAHPGKSGAGLAALVIAVLLAGCGTGPTPMTPGPQEPAPRLPPIPTADGPLDLRVSYPRDSLAIATRGRNFIFGSAGSRRARVWVNGAEVDVQPNGAFLAFLPVPADSVYRVRAALDGAEQRVDVPVSLPPAPPSGRDSTVIVDGSIYPAGAWVAQPGERIDVGFVGTGWGEAWLELGDERVDLVAARWPGAGASDFEVDPDREADDPLRVPGRPAGLESPRPDANNLIAYRGVFAARRLVAADSAVPWPTLTGEARPYRAAGVSDTLPGSGRPSARVVLAAYGDTVRRELPVNLLLADPARPRVGVGLDLDPPERNGDARIIARPGPGGGPYHYLWPNGVELELDGQRNGTYRVRLDDDLHAWTPAGDVQLRIPGTPPPTSRVAVVRLDPQRGHIDVRIALDRRLPFRVVEGDRSVSVVVYGAVSRVNFLQHGRVDPYIERADWSQPTDRAFRLDVHLTSAPWGYDTRWAGGDLVLRLRRPPAIDPDRPLDGLTVGVDPGHGGADSLTMGPTGLTEADANLGVALALRDALERRGARVVLSRRSDVTTSLVERTTLARRQDVDLWVSVHNNAFPDGVDPWSNNGTSVYYKHPRAAGLAWSVQRALLEELGLRDLGIGRADLHQARFTWAPAILTETMFMMIPEHEAFLRTDAGRRRIARAHVRGLEEWLRNAALPRR